MIAQQFTIHAAFCVALFTTYSMAGTIKIRDAKPNSDAFVHYTDKDGNSHTKRISTDGKGKGEGSIGTKAEEATYTDIKVKKVPKTSRTGDLEDYDLKADPETGDSFASLEPFSFPTFDSEIASSLGVNIDIVSLLDSGFSFNVGDTFDVVNGSISVSSAITFTDLELPYTGPVFVYGSDSLEHPTPEPTTTLLIGTALIAMRLIPRRKRA